MILAVLAMFILPLAFSEDASDLDKYLDCLTDKKVDIVFVFDTTNSMGGEISELRAVANKFATGLEASNIDFQLGLVEFRDFPETCDGFSCGSPGDFAYQVKGNGTLTSEIDTFSSWIKELKAGGGGSVGPEAILAALRHAGSDLTWRIDAEKVIILLTDAGPHPDGSCCNAEGDTLEGTVFTLTDQGARVYVIGPDDASLKQIATNTGGQFYEIRSGLSLKPILEKITQSMSCSFNITVEATCENKQLEAKVQLVGKETIPYVAGQTEVWMYLDQAGSRSRYDLSYDPTEEVYKTEVPDVCGPVEMTVYGRVGERSAAQTVHVECGTCRAAAAAETQGSLSISGKVFDDSNGDGIKNADEAGLEGWDVLLDGPDGYSATVKTDRKGFYIFTGLLPGGYELGVVRTQENWTATAPADGVNSVELIDTHESEIDFGFRSETTQNNAPPVINNLTSDKTSPQHDFRGNISWTADATDPDGDQILYRFFLNDTPMTDWMTEKNWTWNPDIGVYRVEVQVKDGKHAGPDETDDRRSVSFIIKDADAFRLIQPTSDGGYVLAGFAGGYGNPYEWLVKTDAEGNLIWDRTFGSYQWGNDGSNFKTYDINVVQQTSDGGYILAGEVRNNSYELYTDSGEVHTDRNDSYNSSGWLLKTNAEGKELWNRSFDRNYENTPAAEDLFDSIQQTSDGGYILVGDTKILNDMVWLLKTDAEGNKLWDKTFESVSSMLNLGVKRGRSVEQTSDGGYILVGYAYGSGDNVAWLIKTDAEGNKLWDKTFGVFPGDVNGGFVHQTSDGGYVLIGSSYNKDDGVRVVIIKTDPDGNELWRKILGKKLYLQVGTEISAQLTSDGGYIITNSGADLSFEPQPTWLLKTDAMGNKLWEMTFGERDNFTVLSVRPASDNGYVLAGGTTPHEDENIDHPPSAWLGRTDPEGNILWRRIYASLATVDDPATNAWVVETDAEGNILWDRGYGE
jgi:hypothetical protein